MLISIITREQPVQSDLQICFGPRACFHECEPSSGVRNEHVDQTIGISAAESLQVFGYIDYSPP